MAEKTFKPVPFYFITTSDMSLLTYNKVFESMKTLKERGFGGAVLFNKPPHGFDADGYLSENWFCAIERFVKAAEELELEIWINDGFNYPPGDAGGRIEKDDPSLKQLRIVRESGQYIVKEVEWGFPAFENPRSSELFIKHTHEQYKKRLGKYFGNVIKGFFSDADNRRVNAGVFLGNELMKDYFPWSVDFEVTFREKFGYDIREHLDDVFDRKDTSYAADYWQHCGDLYAGWFKGNYDWCRENGLEYTFHTSDTSPFTWEYMARSSAFTEGRFSDILKNSDYCGTDQELLELNGGKHYRKDFLYIPKVSWGSSEGGRKSPYYYDLYADVRTKQAQSAAFIYDKKGVMCEMFAATNWGASYEDLREVAAFQVMQGVTFIVPHAYHYLLWKNTKYFAPPDFSHHSHLRHCAEFNGMLTDYVTRCSEGTLDCPIAVVDITEDLWRANADTEIFHKVCYNLNRTPFGYVIADINGIERKKDAFSLIINTSKKDLGDKLYGIDVVNISDIAQLGKALEKLTPKITYSGTGTPHFMVRNTDKGVCAMVANIENEGEITGTVSFGGKEYAISLYSGEIAFFSNDECIFRPDTKYTEIAKLPRIMAVEWENPNFLPIVPWTDKNGVTISQKEESEVISFTFICEGVKEAYLCIPEDCFDRISEIDGIDLGAYSAKNIFDDRYRYYRVSLKNGENTIKLTRSDVFDFTERIFLCGEFNVEVTTENPFYKTAFTTYNLSTCIPESFKVVLTPRTYELDTEKSASLQGHPFYMGKVTYKTEVTVPEGEEYEILVKGAQNGISIKTGDNNTDMMFRPYTAKCPGGKQTIEFSTCATYGNFLEMYPREFGIADGVSIIKKVK
ncbi:MAG: hypothetical protein IJO52_06540 [Clostridia bacterium]|nr:hypothetical protein [Clostridia bacterium]